MEKRAKSAKHVSMQTENNNLETISSYLYTDFMVTLPSGTVTILFSDIEGSTKPAQEYPDYWASMWERQDTQVLASLVLSARTPGMK